jgi:hypothetical protein
MDQPPGVAPCGSVLRILVIALHSREKCRK